MRDLCRRPGTRSCLCVCVFWFTVDVWFHVGGIHAARSRRVCRLLVLGDTIGRFFGGVVFDRVADGRRMTAALDKIKWLPFSHDAEFMGVNLSLFSRRIFARRLRD